MAAKSRASKRPGSGINRASLNPVVTVVLSSTTISNAPKNPKKKDVMIDATTTGSIVTYVWSGTGWR
jgi:hypothetical protein